MGTLKRIKQKSKRNHVETENYLIAMLWSSSGQFIAQIINDETVLKLQNYGENLQLTQKFEPLNTLFKAFRRLFFHKVRMILAEN